MKTLDIVFYPYATVHATLEVPDHIEEPDYDLYIEKHFKELKMDKPKLDFKGIDYDIDG